jgi:Na+-translocating ferredoxin:NAD+ oxidoreductase subunit C
VRHDRFSGGIHPHDKKKATADCPFESMPPSERVVLPLLQHLGRPALPLVKKGSAVLPGMPVAEADGPISAGIHAPVGGKVLSVSRHSSTAGFPLEAITIETDFEAVDIQVLPPLDLATLTPEIIRGRVHAAGIVGQGGAAFPTAVKLTPPKEIAIWLVIINGCECEPYLTRDDRLMRERPAEILSGLCLILRAVGCSRSVIAIEDNKPQAIKSICALAAEYPSIEVVVLPSRYPQGAEKMLIRAVTGYEVTPGTLPLNLGILVHNVSTAIAIHNAVCNGLPAITTALTVSGRGIRRPANLYVPIGTPIRAILEYCGGLAEEARRVLVGGPMMGVAQYDLDAPVLKATSGIVVLTEEEVDDPSETPCLKCGKCIEVCPLSLDPTRLARLVQAERYDETVRLGINACMECGSCAYTCPAHIPLVHWLRLGMKRAAQKAARS